MMLVEEKGEEEGTVPGRGGRDGRVRGRRRARERGVRLAAHRHCEFLRT